MGQPTPIAIGEGEPTSRGYDAIMYRRPNVAGVTDADGYDPPEPSETVDLDPGGRLYDESPPEPTAGPPSADDESQAAAWLRDQLAALRAPLDLGEDIAADEPARQQIPDQHWTAELPAPVDPYVDTPPGSDGVAVLERQLDLGELPSADPSGEEETSDLTGAGQRPTEAPIGVGRSRTGVTVGILAVIAVMVIGGGVAFTYAVRGNNSGLGAGGGPAVVEDPGAADPDGAAPGAGAPEGGAGAPSAGADQEPTATPPPPRPTAAAPQRNLSAPVAGRSRAKFDLVTGATTVSLRGADLGDDLYRISVPDGSGILPRVVDADGRIQLHLVKSGVTGPSSVQIRLSTRVRWQLRITGGAAEHNINLASLRLAGTVDVVGGAARMDLSLPRPDGTSVVRLSGGAKQLTVRVPDRVPVQARLGNGAGTVSIFGRTKSGIAPGSTFKSGRYDEADDRYFLDLPTGVGTLRVTNG